MSQTIRPQVSFHTGVTDVPAYALRLLRKAMGQQSVLRVTGDARWLDALDEMLWTDSPDSFWPHARIKPAAERSAAVLSDGAKLAPVWLVDAASGPEGPIASGSPRALVNLGGEAPQNWQQWDKIIELVSTDPQDREAAQARWRYYRSLGLEPSHHAAK